MEGKAHRRSISYTPNFTQNIFSKREIASADPHTHHGKCSNPMVGVVRRTDSGLHCHEAPSLDCTSGIVNSADSAIDSSMSRPDTLSVWSKLNLTSTELRRCAAEVVSLRTEKFALMREKTEMAERLEHFLKDIETIESEKANFIAKKKELDFQLSIYESENRTLVKQNESLEEKLKEYMQRVADLSTENKNWSSQVTSLQSAKRVLAEEKCLLEEKIATISSQLITLKEENEALNNKFDMEKYILRIEFLQKNLESREGEVAELRMTNTCIVEKYNIQMTELFNLREEHRLEVELLDDKMAQLMASAKEENETNSKLVEELSIERDKLRAEVETLSAKIGDEGEACCPVCGNGNARNERERESIASDVIDGDLKKKINALQQRLKMSEKKRKELHNKLQELRGNIRVYVRCRPFLKSDSIISPAVGEDPRTLQPSLHFHQDHTCVSMIPAAIASVTTSANARGMQGSINHPFVFDRLFNMQSTQEDVYKDVSELVQSALDGYRVCIMSYGQSGSGKVGADRPLPSSSFQHIYSFVWLSLDLYDDRRIGCRWCGEERGRHYSASGGGHPLASGRDATNWMGRDEHLRVYRRVVQRRDQRPLGGLFRHLEHHHSQRLPQ